MPSSQHAATANSTPDLVMFARGVIAILAVWPVLRLAVSEQWGGPESQAKRTWIASELVDAFESKGSQMGKDDVEELVLQAVAEEFECNVEDGSSLTVAKDIVNLWRDVCEGKCEVVEDIEKMADSTSGKRVQARAEEGNGDSDWEDDIDSDEMDVDEVPQLIGHSAEPKMRSLPEIDEDGFTTVAKKTGKNHR